MQAIEDLLAADRDKKRVEGYSIRSCIFPPSLLWVPSGLIDKSLQDPIADDACNIADECNP